MKFQGDIPASKSMMNRALLVKSYFPDLNIIGDSKAEDVMHMKNCTANFSTISKFDCGDAGTVLRFMALRCSREVGEFTLLGSSRLMSRPQTEISFILNQLGVYCEIRPGEIFIRSQGWKKPLTRLRIHRDQSSQFASSLLLNSWNIPFNIEFEMHGGVSEGYWLMSQQLCEYLGMQIDHNRHTYAIRAGQKISEKNIKLEPDYSSVFAIAAAAALNGEAIINNATEHSLQPDFIFIDILKKMQVPVKTTPHLKISKAAKLAPIQFDLKNSPDLFPILAVLCAFAENESVLSGAPQLAHKESHRIKKTKELLSAAGFFAKERPDGMHVYGSGLNPQRKPEFTFDPDQDHRMAMAAGLLMLKGYKIKLKNPRVVNKSFPEFWSILGIKV